MRKHRVVHVVVQVGMSAFAFRADSKATASSFSRRARTVGISLEPETAEKSNYVLKATINEKQWNLRRARPKSKTIAQTKKLQGAVP